MIGRWASVLTLLVVVLSLVLTACGGEDATVTPQPTEPPSAEPTEPPPVEPTEPPEVEKPEKLVVWAWMEGGPIGVVLDEYMEAISKAYEEEFGIKVEFVRQGINTVEAFKAAAEAQEGPDIASIWYGVYNLEEVWAGNAVPIDEGIDVEAAREHWIGLPTSTYDGKIYAGDIYGYGYTTLYNKEQFAEVGLEPPETWDELLEACDIFNEAGYLPIRWSFAGMGWGTALIAGWIWPQSLEPIGGLDALKEAAIGERSFTDPEFKELFVRMDELNKRDCFGPIEDTMVASEGIMEFIAGSGAIVGGPNFNAATVIEEQGEDKIGLMYFPSFTGEPIDWIQVAPISLFVTSWSEYPRWAAKYLEFLHSERGMEIALEVGQGKIVPGDDRFDTSQISDPTARMLAEQVMGGFEKGTWFPDLLLPYAILDGALPAGQKLLIGEITVDEAAQMTEDAAQQWRENNPEAFENYEKWVGD